jgi:polysaccharide pyruvyl transferase WcaK-like protein
MKIAVVGWYHKLNLGDEILENALTRLFSDCELTFWGHAPDRAALAGFDHVVVGGGSVWPNALFDDYLSAGEALATPFSLLGISARRSAGAALTERVLADARAVVVRDQATFALLLEDPKVRIAPDLAWLSPIGPQEEAPRERIIGLNLRAWRRSRWQPEAIGAAVRAAAERVVALPFYYGDRRWEGGHARPDGEVMEAAGIPSPERAELSWFHEARMVVAMRFHALVLAAQAGVPFIAFAYHPKVVAFCKEYGLERYCVPLDHPEALARALVALEDEHAAIRAHLLGRREENVRLARERYGEAREAIMLGATPAAGGRRSGGWLRRLLPGRQN